MAISSSSGSNFIDYPSSPLPSSSSSSASSLDPISESREPTPEYDPTAAHEALAPLHWDAEEFNFEVVSEDDEPKTDDEDLRLLFGRRTATITSPGTEPTPPRKKKSTPPLLRRTRWPRGLSGSLTPPSRKARKI